MSRTNSQSFTPLFCGICFLLFILLSSFSYALNSPPLFVTLAIFFTPILIITITIHKPSRKFISVLIPLAFLLTLTFALNLFLDSAESAVLFTARYYDMVILTFIFFTFFGTRRLKYAILWILSPFEFLPKPMRLNLTHLEIILTVALNFIPIYANNFSQMVGALKLKGYNMRVTTLLKNPEPMLKVLVNCFFDTTDNIEKALIIKGV